VPWMGWVLAINLTALRLVGFVGTGNPPWWATILLTVFTVVVTKRRLTGLRLGHHDA
jgi:Na+-translocating ferredoxin:NAD+ oxidoreductase RnfD subunit